jgi:hypothetical protein
MYVSMLAHMAGKGGAAGLFSPDPWPGGGTYSLFSFKKCSNCTRMWEFSLVELLTYLSWPLIDILLQIIKKNLHYRPVVVLLEINHG